MAQAFFHTHSEEVKIWGKLVFDLSAAEAEIVSGGARTRNMNKMFLFVTPQKS